MRFAHLLWDARITCSGNDSGAEDNCIFYTLLGSCLQAGVDPHTWLTSTLEKIPTLQTPINWEELLP